MPSPYGKAVEHLFRRVSVALMRGNANALLKSLEDLGRPLLETHVDPGNDPAPRYGEIAPSSPSSALQGRHPINLGRARVLDGDTPGMTPQSDLGALRAPFDAYNSAACSNNGSPRSSHFAHHVPALQSVELTHSSDLQSPSYTFSSHSSAISKDPGHVCADLEATLSAVHSCYHDDHIGQGSDPGDLQPVGTCEGRAGCTCVNPFDYEPSMQSSESTGSVEEGETTVSHSVSDDDREMRSCSADHSMSPTTAPSDSVIFGGFAYFDRPLKPDVSFSAFRFEDGGGRCSISGWEVDHRIVKQYEAGNASIAWCLSKDPVFAQSPIYDTQYGWYPATICKMPSGCNSCVFANGAFARLMDASPSEGYRAAFQSLRVCAVRMCLVREWGREYRKRAISCTPCWSRIRSQDPLGWLDTTFQRMRGPDFTIHFDRPIPMHTYVSSCVSGTRTIGTAKWKKVWNEYRLFLEICKDPSRHGRYDMVKEGSRRERFETLIPELEAELIDLAAIFEEQEGHQFRLDNGRTIDDAIKEGHVMLQMLQRAEAKCRKGRRKEQSVSSVNNNSIVSVHSNNMGSRRDVNHLLATLGKISFNDSFKFASTNRRVATPYLARPTCSADVKRLFRVQRSKRVSTILNRPSIKTLRRKVPRPLIIEAASTPASGSANIGPVRAGVTTKTLY